MIKSCVHSLISPALFILTSTHSSLASTCATALNLLFPPSSRASMLPNPTGTFFLLIYLFFSWRITALHNSVGFCQTSSWISHRYTYVPSLLNLPFSSPHHPSRLSQSTSFVSLYHMANFPCLSALHMIIYVFQCYSLKSSLFLFPPLCPKVCPLCLHILCCPANRIFIDSI